MDTQARVAQVFADLTRYPIEILTPHADLEADLGIDSVKRTEILAALQKDFGLPNDVDIPREGLVSIAAVASFIDSARVGGAANGHAAAPGYVSVAPAARSTATPRPPGSSAPATSPTFHPPPAARAAQPSAYPTPAKPSFSPPAAPRHRPTAGPAPVDGIDWASVPASPPAPRHAVESTARQVPPAHHYAAQAVSHQPAPSAHSHPAAARPPAQGPLSCRDVLGALRSVLDEALDRLDGRASPSAPNGAFVDANPFRGRVVFVTGSGRGLGRVIARRLGALGAKLVINSFHSRQLGDETAHEIESAGGEVIHLWGSVAKRDHMERMFAEIEQHHGGLDILVSNASNGVIAPLSQVEEDHWDRSFRTNVVGLHRASLLAAPLMARRGGGRIIAISSPGAHRYVEYFGCQGPVKAAMESLVRYLAVELGPYNVQVNALSAGPLYGDLLNAFPESERLIPYWESRTNDGRLATEEEMAETLLWMLHPSTRPINGAVVMADYTGSIRL